MESAKTFLYGQSVRGNHLLLLLNVYKMVCLLVPDECDRCLVPTDCVAKYTCLCLKTRFVSLKTAILKNSRNI